MRKWVLDIGQCAGKRYRNRKHIVKKNAEGRAEWPYRGVYLDKSAREFEEAVRAAAIEAGVELCEYAEISVVMYWPDKDSSTKRKRRTEVVKRGRPDLSNVYKCVEDALQKIKVPVVLYRQRKEVLRRMEADDDMGSLGLEEKMLNKKLARIEKKIAQHVEKALVGAVVRNDREILGLKATTLFVPPTYRAGVRVYIKETTREEHFHPSLLQWLAGEEE